MKWINEIRTLIIDFRTNFFMLVVEQVRKSKDEATILLDSQELMSLEAKLIVHLYGRGPIENNVLALARSYSSAGHAFIRDNTSVEKQQVFAAYGDLLALHSNYLFKQEWERVKIEASGVVYALYLRYRSRKRIVEYIKFASEEGYFVPITQKSKHQFSTVKK